MPCRLCNELTRKLSPQNLLLFLLLGAKNAKYLSEDKAITVSFDVVQRAVSTAAAAISKLGVRFAAGNDDLAQLVRKDQDLSAENERLDKNLVAASQALPTSGIPTRGRD